MDQFLKTHQLWKPNQDERDKLNNSIAIKETELVI